MTYPDLYLASASPRRRLLLEALGIEFQIVRPDVEESSSHPHSPRALVQHNAALKAVAGAELIGNAENQSLVIGADTIVVLDGEVLGKPTDRAHAEAMLARMSGRTHEVHTGIALQLHPKGGMWLDAERSEVTFETLSAERIRNYVATGEADDKAGSYGIQGDGRVFIASLKGDLSNVIGLPLNCLARGIDQMAGFDPMAGKSAGKIVQRAFADLPSRLFELH